MQRLLSFERRGETSDGPCSCSKFTVEGWITHTHTHTPATSLALPVELPVVVAAVWGSRAGAKFAALARA